MNFEDALTALKQGKCVTNKNWAYKNKYLKLQKPDKNSKMSEPYIYLRTDIPMGDIERVPWTATQLDIMGESWDLMDFEKPQLLPCPCHPENHK